MNKYTKKYRKIVDKLIKKSFPRLKGFKLILTEGLIFLSKASATVCYWGLFAHVDFHKRIRNFSKDTIDSLIAHELSHMDLIKKMKLFEKFVFLFKWFFSKKTRAWWERQADLHTIKKGYGNGMIKLINEVAKDKDKKELKEWMKRRGKNGYLNINEIKSYAKKIGKW